MTCREILEFAASLKVAGTKEYRKKVVENMIDHLQITKAADTIIGSQFIKGISGGERKRVAIGVELISDPSVLFLDEPTSGLDGYTADMIVDLLRKEANKGRTVIATIHQPSYNMYRNFQRLILLFEGKIVYQAPAKKSRRYFADIGYATPKLINPLDYYMGILHIVSRSHKTEEEIKRLNHITSAYEESKSTYYCPNSNFNLEENDLPPLSTLSHRYKASWLDQFKLNLYRNFKHTTRDPMLLKVLISQSISQIAIYDIIWNNLDTSYTGIQSRIGFMFNFFLTVLFQFVQPLALTCNF
jgi:ABC-type multidrug transport system ATPase subunit